MESNISKELRFKNSPVAVIFSDVLPNDAVAFDPAAMKGICSLSALKEVMKGNSVYFSNESQGCPGMKSGLGFTDMPNIPGGIEYFLSCGRGEGFPPGEKLKKTPEIAKKYYDNLPKNVMNAKYIVFRPIDIIGPEEPKLIIFLANPDQLSALISLFTYESTSLDEVFSPMTSGCSSLIKLPLDESSKEKPRAVIGLIDIWARPIFDPDIFAFTVPYKSYIQMEENSKDCFFQAKTWDGVKSRLI